MRPLLLGLLTISCLCTSPAFAAEDTKDTKPVSTEQVSQSPVSVSDAWVRESPPGVKMSAAYMTLTNSTEHEVILIGASSPEFGKVELHNTVVEEGIAKMIPQTEIPIAAKQSVAFKPGGLHLMLLEGQQNIVAGNKINLVLKFSDKTEQSIVVEIKSALNQKPAQ